MKPVILLCLMAPGLTSQTEKPVALITGLGTLSHPIATRNALAQKFFDQGLTLTYGFNRYEALRSFRKSAELDPQAAMPWWGMAQALGPYVNMDGDTSFDIKESCAALDRGLEIRGAGATDREYLEAAATRCPDFANPSRYIAAMRTLAGRHPDDPDAQVLYAESLMIPTRWKWYSGDGTPATGTAEAERVLEGVLRRNPNHSGANHFYIHAVESSPNPERAIPSSQRLMGLVPAAGHVVHMPGHIWLVIGDFESAVAVNERAAEVDRRYFAQTGVNGSYYGYYVHNLQFILYAREMQGHLAETRKAEQQIRTASAPMLKMMPEMAGTFEATLTMAELRMNRWDDILAAPKPAGPDPLRNAMWHYARAISLAMKGRLDEARTAGAEFGKARDLLNAKDQWGVNKLGDVMALASTILEARLAPNAAGAIAPFRKAVEQQDALVYDEPPAWYYPVRESLGAALLRSGDATAAETVFREGLRRSPRNGRMLFGLLESLKAQQKSEAVVWVQKEFDTAWKGADITLRIEAL